MRRLFILSLALLSSGCDEIRRTIDPDNYRGRADSNVWASKNDILAAAAICEEPNIEPREAADAWSIETKDGKPISNAKSQCIDRELDRQKLLATR